MVDCFFGLCVSCVQVDLLHPLSYVRAEFNGVLGDPKLNYLSSFLQYSTDSSILAALLIISDTALSYNNHFFVETVQEWKAKGETSFQDSAI
ncbi:hypothetical protein SCA6_005152 [Theobroma cacao]